MAVSDLVCLSHLRWGFVYQRPNHLMARAGQERRVFFVEEPEPGEAADLRIRAVDGISLVVPVLPDGLPAESRTGALSRLMRELFAAEGIASPWLWYYTPMAVPWTRRLPRSVVVYDCMDELSAFRFAPPELLALEDELIGSADIVFTGGRSLFEAKQGRHVNTHLFPSSVDAAHFGRARLPQPDPGPTDQARIPRPRIGYFGVIDERIDLELLAAVAAARPDWQLVMLGPLAKLDRADLPQAPNLHWLGPKRYEELPAYLAGWDVAMMPFAINEATRFISPTKTPEYLAGGRPVVSTPVADVVDPYGQGGLVSIAGDATDFVRAIEAALQADPAPVIARADERLASQSWDRTWLAMSTLVSECEPPWSAAMSGSRATREMRPTATMTPGTAAGRTRPGAVARSVR
jgi:UDP-galactopyranose mutase